MGSSTRGKQIDRRATHSGGQFKSISVGINHIINRGVGQAANCRVTRLVGHGCAVGGARFLDDIVGDINIGGGGADGAVNVVKIEGGG